MKGRVLDFNFQAGEGIISGEDGNRYSFVNAQWKTSEINPSNEIEVDFIGEEGVATGIYAKAKEENSMEKFVKSNNIFMRYYVDVLKNYVKFDGRARREEYWFFTLFSFLVAVVLTLISAGTLDIIYSLAVFLPSLAVAARRLHDTNRSAWWLLIGLIPLIGIIVLIVFFVFDSDKEENRFGLSPKYNNN